jgi:hypothetical protein
VPQVPNRDTAVAHGFGFFSGGAPTARGNRPQQAVKIRKICYAIGFQIARRF